MNSTRLQDIKKESARVVIQYTNGYIDSRLKGRLIEESVFDGASRLHALYQIISNSFLSGSDVYIGSTVLSDADVFSVYEKIQHYKGRFEDIDISAYSSITEDDGDGGACTGGGTSVSDDHYRSGNLAVVAGANAVTFIKNGVPSPLASSDYTVEAWVIAASGQRQNNLVITTQTAGGFVASDVLKAGTLYYIATLNT